MQFQLKPNPELLAKVQDDVARARARLAGAQ